MKSVRVLPFLALTGLLLSACNDAPAPAPDTTPPSASVTLSTGTLAAAGTVTYTATAEDAVGVTRVEFYDNGKLVATDEAAPYTASKAYTLADNGAHTITVKAYDAAGNVGEGSATLTVALDGTAPTVGLTVSPTTLVNPGAATFTATASDTGGIAKVEFYDGAALISTDTQAPFTASKTYAYADNGAHAIRARAYDSSGNSAEASTILTVAIADANEPNDSVAAATALALGTPLSGAIAGQARDMDYFKFNAAAGDMLKLTVKSVSANAGSTLDPYVMVLMPDGKTVLEQDDDSGAGLESELRFNAPAAGTYTVVVTSFDIHDSRDVPTTVSDDKATNTYQIALTRR